MDGMNFAPTIVSVLVWQWWWLMFRGEYLTITTPTAVPSIVGPRPYNHVGIRIRGYHVDVPNNSGGIYELSGPLSFVVVVVAVCCCCLLLLLWWLPSDDKSDGLCLCVRPTDRKKKRAMEVHTIITPGTL
jgi:hypothetical protein